MAQQILHDQMIAYLENKLESGISRCHGRASSIMAQVTNHLIISTLWYSLFLWTGQQAALVRMKRKVVTFVWCG